MHEDVQLALAVSFLEGMLALKKLEIEEIDRALNSDTLSPEYRASELRRREHLSQQYAKIKTELDLLSR